MENTDFTENPAQSPTQATEPQVLSPMDAHSSETTEATPTYQVKPVNPEAEYPD